MRGHPRTSVVVGTVAALVLGAAGSLLAQDGAPPRDYLFLWTASADTTGPDFLAVVDVTDEGGRYGRLVATLPVPGRRNMPHHTEHVVVTGYGGMQHRVMMLRLDPETGMLSLDDRFGDAGSGVPGMSFEGRAWPHGGIAAGIPHGAVFSRP